MLRTEFGHQRLHLQPGQRVERGEWFVEQEKLRLAHQGSGQRDPLRLTAGERPWPFVGMRLQADFPQCGHRRFPGALARGWPMTTLRHTFMEATSLGSWKTVVRTSRHEDIAR